MHNSIDARNTPDYDGREVSFVKNAIFLPDFQLLIDVIYIYIIDASFYGGVVMSNVIVTTGDLKQDYEILGPVYFQVSNKGLFGSALSNLRKKYVSEIKHMKNKGTMSADRADWGFLYGEWSVGQSDFESAFFIATEELKKRAEMVGADAIIAMRQDIDMDTNGFAYFYLQMYGTAVKLK